MLSTRSAYAFHDVNELFRLQTKHVRTFSHSYLTLQAVDYDSTSCFILLVFCTNFYRKFKVDS
jgi:hypothetical protein